MLLFPFHKASLSTMTPTRLRYVHENIKHEKYPDKNMTPTMLRSILSKTVRKEEDESWQDEKETDQLGLSLIEHCDTFDDKPPNTSKVKMHKTRAFSIFYTFLPQPESPLRRILSSPLKSIQKKSEASYDSFLNSNTKLKLDAE